MADGLLSSCRLLCENKGNVPKRRILSPRNAQNLSVMTSYNTVHANDDRALVPLVPTEPAISSLGSLRCRASAQLRVRSRYQTSQLATDSAVRRANRAPAV